MIAKDELRSRLASLIGAELPELPGHAAARLPADDVLLESYIGPNGERITASISLDNLAVVLNSPEAGLKASGLAKYIDEWCRKGLLPK